MTKNHSEVDPLRDLELSRRELIQRIVVGSAFALPVVASFDMASLGVSSAYANSPNQFPPKPPSFASSNTETFTVGEALTFAIWISGSPAVQVTEQGKLPTGLSFTAIVGNYDDGNDTNATISGKPAAGTGGVYPITLHATNGIVPNATQKFTIVVNESPVFTSAAKATVHVGTEGHVKVTTRGHPHAKVSLSGKLPHGMHFKPDPAKGTASISGRAHAVGIHHLKLTASDGVSPKATQEFVLTVKPKHTHGRGPQ